MNNVSNQYGLTYMTTNQLTTSAYNYALTETNIDIDSLYLVLNETIINKLFEIVKLNKKVYFVADIESYFLELEDYIYLTK